MPRPGAARPSAPTRPGSIAPVNVESALPALPPSPALLAAGAALAAQRAALAAAAGRLEAARARLPVAAAGPSWRGAAQTAYAAGVHDLGRGLDEAAHSVRVAQQCTARAVAAIALRVG